MRKNYLFIILAILLGCSKRKEQPEVILEKAQLIFPTKNQVCTQGKVISDKQSTVVFKWAPSNGAESYQLLLTNLSNNQQKTWIINTQEIELALEMNTPYSWSILARSSQATVSTASEVWKFYNAAPGITNYAPFPAEIKFPLMGQQLNAPAGKVTLNWLGQDPDGDVATYNIYFDNKPSPKILTTGHQNPYIDVNVSAPNTYYWRVITLDQQGNTSDSGEFQFSIK